MKTPQEFLAEQINLCAEKFLDCKSRYNYTDGTQQDLYDDGFEVGYAIAERLLGNLRDATYGSGEHLFETAPREFFLLQKEEFNNFCKTLAERGRIGAGADVYNTGRRNALNIAEILLGNIEKYATSRAMAIWNPEPSVTSDDLDAISGQIAENPGIMDNLSSTMLQQLVLHLTQYLPVQEVTPAEAAAYYEHADAISNA